MDKAVIFDMDGVLVDNTAWHIKAWTTFCQRHSVNMSPEQILSNLGNTNKDYLNFLFARNLHPDESERYGREKEEIYRSIYKEYIKPFKGLMDFFNILEREKFAIGLATSAPSINVDFTLDNLGIKDRFQAIVDGSRINKGKPDPEIYLMAAGMLNIPPDNCIVFEDSIHGIQAAVSAGMSSIGVLSSQTKEKLSKANYLINDFTEVDAKLLNQVLFNCPLA
jgi:beta-phosphoglucomutase